MKVETTRTPPPSQNLPPLMTATKHHGKIDNYIYTVRPIVDKDSNYGRVVGIYKVVKMLGKE